VDAAQPDATATTIAATVNAQLTRIAAASTPTATLQVYVPTDASTQISEASPTVGPTATATSAPTPCNRAEFIADMTVKDLSTFKAGESFTKTWRLKNNGTCTWNGDYSLTFVSGDQMSGAKSVKLPKTVAPGETIDVSVNLKAPLDGGTYLGYWMLSDARGYRFGIGPQAQGLFWVTIKVQAKAITSYDFVDDVCDADWTSNAGDLPCPGDDNDPDGSVGTIQQPNLEGHVENETGLLTRPQASAQGWIQGNYPLFKIQAGDRFAALIACLDGADACSVRFVLAYETKDGDSGVLKEWTEIQDGGFQKIDVDLSSLKGKEVHLILKVEAGASGADDQAIWVSPRLLR
jgi:hypothetical protein